MGWGDSDSGVRSDDVLKPDLSASPSWVSIGLLNGPLLVSLLIHSKKLLLLTF